MTIIPCFGILDGYFYDYRSEKYIEKEIRQVVAEDKASFIFYLDTYFSREILKLCRELRDAGRVDTITVIVDCAEFKRLTLEERKQKLEQFKDVDLKLLNTQGMNERERLMKVSKLIVKNSTSIIGHFVINESRECEIVRPMYDVTGGKDFISIQEILE